jgi:hypothetical protein
MNHDSKVSSFFWFLFLIRDAHQKEKDLPG